jgi:hypothetical protein
MPGWKPPGFARFGIWRDAMSDAFVIQWKSKINGRAGRSSKTFSREAGEQLARELNAEYPEILHELVSLSAVNEPTENVGAIEPEPIEESSDEMGEESEIDDNDSDSFDSGEGDENPDKQPKTEPPASTESEPSPDEALET